MCIYSTIISLGCDAQRVQGLRVVIIVTELLVPPDILLSWSWLITEPTNLIQGEEIGLRLMWLDLKRGPWGV